MAMKELLEASFRVWVDKESDASEERFLPEDWDKSYVSAEGRVIRPSLKADLWSGARSARRPSGPA